MTGLKTLLYWQPKKTDQILQSCSCSFDTGFYDDVFFFSEKWSVEDKVFSSRPFYPDIEQMRFKNVQE
uniref:Neur_chan_LBD domain-containing protein n=1 Tax=Angiostrongylus cantonensis TaxID=6313 RepID=A0A0K0D932_ANGCA